MKQTRFFPIETCGLQLREPQEGQTESREIEGRPIVFGVRSVNLTPWSTTRKVYEVLEPGCISRELLQKSDVVLNLNHNSDVVNVLGRYRNNPERDTLLLALRADGIDCRCDLPRTNNANDTLELIRRGDITGMSFAFSDDNEDTENGVSLERTNDIEDGKEVWLRHVKRITGLYDVSIVTHPAYDQTTVVSREQSDAIEKAIEEQLKRECGGDDDNKRDDDTKDEPDTKDDDTKDDDTTTDDDTTGEPDDTKDDDTTKDEPDTKDDKDDEQRALEEQAQRFREQRAMRLRAQHRRCEIDIESLNY